MEVLFQMIEGVKSDDETYRTHSGALNDAEALLRELK